MKHQQWPSIGFWLLTWMTVGVLVVLPFNGSEASDIAQSGWILILWQLLPPAVGALLWLSGKRWYAAFWQIPIALLIVGTNLQVFLWPSSSTTALLGLFVPLWSLIVVGPVLLIIAKITQRIIDRIHERPRS